MWIYNAAVGENIVLTLGIYFTSITGFIGFNPNFTVEIKFSFLICHYELKI